MQWGSMNNILKCEIEICALSLSPATPLVVTSVSLFLQQRLLVGY